MMISIIKNIVKNIIYVFKYSLEEREKEILYESLIRVEDIYKYEIMNGVGNENSLSVISPEETLDLLLNKPKSFCRFGDGEILIMQGLSIPFQKYNSNLATKLLEILSNKEENLYVGINYNYFHSTKSLNEFNRKFYLINSKVYRDFLINKCSKSKDYIAAGFNQMYMIYDYNLDNYFEKLKMLFKNKELVIFVGEGVLDDLKFDLFEFANNKEFIYGPSKNAYDHYEELLSRAKICGKDKTLCFILGPTSKVLAYELSKLGYIAWDIGHMAKDYNAYMLKTEKTMSNIVDFYKPD